MNSNLIKKGTVSLVVAGFLMSGINAGASIQTLTELLDFNFSNSNITGDINGNTSIISFTTNSSLVTDIGSNLTLSLKSSDFSTLYAEIVDSSGAVLNSNFSTFSDNTTSINLTTSSLSDGASYKIRVFNSNKVRENISLEGRANLYSIKVGSTTETYTTNTIDLINAPTFDSATAGSIGTTNLAFSTSSTYTMNYFIFDSTGVQRGTSTTGSYTDTGLSQGMNYTYTICAQRSDLTNTTKTYMLCTAQKSVTTLAITNDYNTIESGSNTDTTQPKDGKILYQNGVQASVGQDGVASATVDNSNLTSQTDANPDGTANTQMTIKKADGTELQTQIVSKRKVEVIVNSDGSVKQTATINKTENPDSKVEQVSATVNNSGQISANVKLQNGKEVNINADVGSKVLIEEDGSMITENKVQSDTGDVDVKTTVSPSGKVESTMTLNGKTFKVTLPINAENGEVSITKDSIIQAFKNSGKYQAYLKQGGTGIRAVTVEGDSIEIVGTTSWQRFEETQKFDGTRSIVLVLGGANIVTENEEIVMEKGVEYLLPPTETENTAIIDTPSQNQNSISLESGWNLVALPVNSEITDLTLLGEYTAIWKYSNENWDNNPSSLKAEEGFWINSTTSKEITFDGSNYTPNLLDLNGKWRLLGTGDTVNTQEINTEATVWKFKSKTWIKNPTSIYSGEGFWIK